MLVTSYILSTIALVIGLLTFPFFITLPVCIIIGLIALIFAVINFIKKHNGENLVLNIAPIVYSLIVITLLIFIFAAMYKTAVIDNIALLIPTLNIT